MQYEKKRKGRSSALRNRPKSSMLEHHRDSVNKSQKRKMTKKPTKNHNNSIENL